MNRKILFLLLPLLFPAVAFASHQETFDLANQLEYASKDLARNTRSVRGFNSVSHSADRLSRKAEELTDTIARNRSSAYVRTRFNDVSRYYEKLEEAFFRASRNYGSRYVNDSFENVAYLYDRLSIQFYGDGYYQSFRSGPNLFIPKRPYYFDRSPVYRAPRVLINPPRHYLPRDPAPRSSRDNDRRRNSDNNQQDNHDHRSPVIERQNRNEDSRRNLNEQLRRDSKERNGQPDDAVERPRDRSPGDTRDNQRDNSQPRRLDDSVTGRSRRDDSQTRQRLADPGTSLRDRAVIEQRGDNADDKLRDTPASRRNNGPVTQQRDAANDQSENRQDSQPDSAPNDTGRVRQAETDSSERRSRP